jgi:hypothetical protein
MELSFLGDLCLPRRSLRFKTFSVPSVSSVVFLSVSRMTQIVILTAKIR